jgi:ketosteroid isomerase-like protein
MDAYRVEEWLRRYIEAWKSYDSDQIRDLFSEDVSYRYHPYDDPVVGRDGLVDSWMEEPDAPESWEAHYEPVAVDGDVAVAVGHSSYKRADGSVEVYDNCFVMRFDEEGRCRSFTEWYVKRPPKST